MVSNIYLVGFMFQDGALLKVLINGSVTSHLYHDRKLLFVTQYS